MFLWSCLCICEPTYVRKTEYKRVSTIAKYTDSNDTDSLTRPAIRGFNHNYKKENIIANSIHDREVTLV